MGFFFELTHPDLGPAIEEALKIDPASIQNLRSEVDKRTAQAKRGVSKQLRWGRLIGALVVVAMMGVAVIYTEQHALQGSYKMFTHSFELVFGILLGLLGGEAAAKT